MSVSFESFGALPAHFILLTDRLKTGVRAVRPWVKFRLFAA